MRLPAWLDRFLGIIRPADMTKPLKLERDTMAIYVVTRTDAPAPEEFTEAVVRAKGRLQARNLITAFPYLGVLEDGSNLRVERLAEGRDLDNRVIVAAHLG